MSVRVMSDVFDYSEARGNDRLVLLAIADEADDDGTNAYPGVKTIASKVRLPERTVTRCIGRLEDSGELRVIRPAVGGRGKFVRYIVTVQKGDTLATPAGLESPQKDAINPQKGDTPTPLTSDDGEYPRRKTHKAIARPMPEDFTVSEAMRSWAQEKVPSVNVDNETEAFKDHHEAKGTKFVNWEKAWRGWMRRAVTFQRGDTRPAAVGFAFGESVRPQPKPWSGHDVEHPPAEVHANGFARARSAFPGSPERSAAE